MGGGGGDGGGGGIVEPAAARRSRRRTARAIRSEGRTAGISPGGSPHRSQPSDRRSTQDAAIHDDGHARAAARAAAASSTTPSCSQSAGSLSRRQSSTIAATCSGRRKTSTMSMGAPAAGPRRRPRASGTAGSPSQRSDLGIDRDDSIAIRAHRARDAETRPARVGGKPDHGDRARACEQGSDRRVIRIAMPHFGRIRHDRRAVRRIRESGMLVTCRSSPWCRHGRPSPRRPARRCSTRRCVPVSTCRTAARAVTAVPAARGSCVAASTTRAVVPPGITRGRGSGGLRAAVPGACAHGSGGRDPRDPSRARRRDQEPALPHRAADAARRRCHGRACCVCPRSKSFTSGPASTST